MAQNTSTAVMQQRAEPNDSLDFFPTPPWAVRALCKHVLPRLIGHGQSLRRVLEPACGQGHTGPTTMVWIPRCRTQLEQSGDYQ